MGSYSSVRGFILKPEKKSNPVPVHQKRGELRHGPVECLYFRIVRCRYLCLAEKKSLIQYSRADSSCRGSCFRHVSESAWRRNRRSEHEMDRHRGQCLRPPAENDGHPPGFRIHSLCHHQSGIRQAGRQDRSLGAGFSAGNRRNRRNSRRTDRHDVRSQRGRNRNRRIRSLHHPLWRTRRRVWDCWKTPSSKSSRQIPSMR